MTRTATSIEVLLRTGGCCLMMALALTLGGCASTHGVGEDGGRRLDAGSSLVDGGPPADRGMIDDDTGIPGDSGHRHGEDCISVDGGYVPPPDAGPPPVEGCRDGEIWEGYIESYSLPSGSDAVRIALDPATGDGPRTGHVCFGEGTPPAPPGDPNVGYPPGVDGDSRTATFTPWEGFEYTVLEGSAEGSRIQLSVTLGELWEAWCQLQTPYPLDTGGDSYMCLPNRGGGGSDDRCWVGPAGDCVLVDCGKVWLCMEVCGCTETGCSAFPVGEVRFDFQVMDTRADGSVTLPAGVRNIHLTHP